MNRPHNAKGIVAGLSSRTSGLGAEGYLARLSAELAVSAIGTELSRVQFDFALFQSDRPHMVLFSNNAANHSQLISPTLCFRLRQNDPNVCWIPASRGCKHHEALR